MSEPKSKSAGTGLLSLFGEEGASNAAQVKNLRGLAKLMSDIEEARLMLQRREALMQNLHERLVRDLTPIEDQFLAARIETLRVLGKHLKAGWMKKRDAGRLREALRGLADELEAGFGADLEAERIALLDQEFMTEEEEREDDAMRALFQEHLDAMLRERGGAGPAGAGRMDGPESRMDGRAHSVNEEKAGHEDGDAPRRRRKAGEGSQAGKRREKEATLAGDIRALYLLLARALHPDKEADEGRRREKTAWMQKVTAAYGARNLAGLLDIMARNPLDAVGPYLSQAPLKTVQGFAKRLRRELASLRKQAEGIWERIAPEFRGMLGPDGLKEAALKAHITGARRQVRFVEERLDVYRTRAGAEQFLAILKKHSWEGLI